MPVRVGINGFGRIGRNVFRAARARSEELGRRDRVGRGQRPDGRQDAGAPAQVRLDPGALSGYRSRSRRGCCWRSTATQLRVLAERDPAALPWGELGVDVVIESTGLFTDRESAAKHLAQGAKKVIISAPASDPDATVVLGVNFDEVYDRERARRDLQRVVHDQLPGAGGEGGQRHGRDRARPDDDDPRVHRRPAAAGHAAQRPAPRAGGGDQPDPGVDGRGEGDRPGDPGAAGQAERLRRARAGADGLGRRPDGRVHARDERRGGQRGAEGGGGRAARWRGSCSYTEDPIVSTDIVSSPFSSIVDSLLTAVIDGTMLKVVAWYDNEWGYSNRLVDLALRVL